jgi:hypothetical protein
LWAAGVERDVGWKTMSLSFGVFSIACVPPVVVYSGGYIMRRKGAIVSDITMDGMVSADRATQ